MRTPLIRRLAYSCSLYALWTATASAATPSEPATGWQACSAVQDGQERLACFDQPLHSMAVQCLHPRLQCLPPVR